MKFKVASILELVVPLSILVVLSLSACGGGGGAYGSSVNAYDGTWNVSLTGMAVPAPGGASSVLCAPPQFVPATISHGFGHATEITTCYYTYANPTGPADFNTNMDIGITYGGLASSAAVVTVDVYGGTKLIGTCDTPNSCAAAPNFYMYR